MYKAYPCCSSFSSTELIHVCIILYWLVNIDGIKKQANLRRISSREKKIIEILDPSMTKGNYGTAPEPSENFNVKYIPTNGFNHV